MKIAAKTTKNLNLKKLIFQQNIFHFVFYAWCDSFADDTIKTLSDEYIECPNKKQLNNRLTSGELLSNDRRAVGFVSS